MIKTNNVLSAIFVCHSQRLYTSERFTSVDQLPAASPWVTGRSTGQGHTRALHTGDQWTRYTGGKVECRLPSSSKFSLVPMLTQAQSTLRRRNLKTEVSLWKRIKYFPSTLRCRNVKAQQSPAILDLCLKKTRSEKSRDYRDTVSLQKARFLTD